MCCYETNKFDHLTKALTQEILSKPPRGYSFERSLKEFSAVKVISTGRFGSTILAAHPKTDKFVTILTYHKNLLHDSFQQHLPFREKKLIESLDSHCGIHKVLGALSDHTSLYLVFDFAPMTTLSSYSQSCIQKYGHMDEKFVVYIVACILSTLKYAHLQQILHRNIHPDSILMDYKGKICLSGWCYAKVVEERSYTLCGHVDYLCPEALLGDTGYGKGIDYWALGILIFELLVGRTPFIPIESQWQQLERERGGIAANKARDIPSDHSLGLLDESTHSILGTSLSGYGSAGYGTGFQSGSSTTPGGSNSFSSPALPTTSATSCDLQTVEHILYHDLHFPIHLSSNAKSIIKALCQKNVNQRLGCRRRDGFNEVSSQSWFGHMTEVDWRNIEKGTYLPPTLPLTLELPSSLNAMSLCKADPAHNSQKIGIYRGYTCLDWHEFELCSSLKEELGSSSVPTRSKERSHKNKVVVTSLGGSSPTAAVCHPSLFPPPLISMESHNRGAINHIPVR